ncbi:hypothetical protein ATW91_10195 [Oenococcus oeni]|nr:hypothetical protein ATW91_10195 [Oenococcus oeni]
MAINRNSKSTSSNIVKSNRQIPQISPGKNPTTKYDMFNETSLYQKKIGHLRPICHFKRSLNIKIEF